MTDTSALPWPDLALPNWRKTYASLHMCHGGDCRDSRGANGRAPMLYGFGQNNALPRTTVPILNPNMLSGAYAAGAQNINR
jgi:hypothetical protein